MEEESKKNNKLLAERLNENLYNEGKLQGILKIKILRITANC